MLSSIEVFRNDGDSSYPTKWVPDSTHVQGFCESIPIFGHQHSTSTQNGLYSGFEKDLRNRFHRRSGLPVGQNKSLLEEHRQRFYRTPTFAHFREVHFGFAKNNQMLDLSKTLPKVKESNGRASKELESSWLSFAVLDDQKRLP